MQPPKPYQGVPYEKDMFTFLPALANQDVLVESERKRKSYTSDGQITIPAPTMAYGSYGNLNPKENSSDLHGKELQSFVPASSPTKSLSYRTDSDRKDSDSAKFGIQNDSSTRSHSDERVCHEYFSYASQSQSSNYNDSQSLVRSSAGLTHLSSNWSPLVTGYSNQNGSQDSNAHLGGDVNGFHFPESHSYGLQKPNLTQVEGSTSNELVNAESQNLQKNVSIPGIYAVSSDGKSFNEHSCQANTSSNIGHGDTSNFARVEGTNTLGNNVGYSLQNLLEFNNILQQALRLVSASSDTGLTINQDGSIQGCEGDASRINSTLNPLTQNLSHSSIDGTSSKDREAGRNLDKSIISGNEGSLNFDDGLQSEFGSSTLAQKLWDGTLQLSSSVSVSAVAFFKSGEWMPDFDWSGSVEVKGKVRLDAFEKYVQDLPRSRSRGLMVMSLLAKEASTGDLKSMTEVARKYKEGKRVGIAQLNKGVDMYICPHSDAIITILAKHGFFKGMTAVKEKSDPLLGCVVWRKNSTSASTTETAMIDAPYSGTSLSKQSDGISEKIQNGVGGGNNSSENNSQEFSVAHFIGQPEQSMIPENKSASVSVNNTQISEFYSNAETFKLILSNPPVLNQPAVLCDDEDLPEYDFGSVITQTFESTVAVPFSPTPKSEQYKDSHVHQPIEEMRPESSTVSETLPYRCFQGQPLNMKNQSEAHNSSMQARQKMQIGDCTISSSLSVQGLASENIGRQPETRIPSWSVVEKTSVDGCTATKNPKNHFDDDDDDDMPEWCPPDFKRMRTEVDEKSGPSFGSSNSMVSRFSFTDLATGRQLPPPPPLPPLPPPRAVVQVQFLDKAYPTDSQLSGPPPLPQLPPPAVAQMQLLDKNYHTEHWRSLPPSLPVLPPPSVAQVQLLDKNHPIEHQRSLPPPLPPVPPPPAVAQVQFFDKNHPTEHHHCLPPPLPPRPAVAQVQFLDKNHPIECQRSRPPPLPPQPPPRAVAQVELLDESYPTEHQRSRPPPLPPLPPPAVDQVELLDKNHPTEHRRSRPAQLPPPPPPAVARVELLNENHPTEYQRSLPPLPSSRPPSSTRGQLFDEKYSPTPYFPKPAGDEPMHGYSDANEPSTRDSSPAAQPHIHFQAKRYPTPPSLPPAPPPPLNRPHYSKNNRPASRFSKRAVDNFMHDRPVAQSSHARFQDRRYSPGRRLPPPAPEKSSANRYMHRRPADVSKHKQFRHNDYSGPRARPPAYKPETGGSRNEVLPSPPGSTRNSAFRRRFDRHGNHSDRSNWRSSRS